MTASVTDAGCKQTWQFAESPRFCLMVPTNYREGEVKPLGTGGEVTFFEHGDEIRGGSVMVRWYAKRDNYNFADINESKFQQLQLFAPETQSVDQERGRTRYRYRTDLARVVGGAVLDGIDHVFDCQTGPGQSDDNEDMARIMMCDSLVLP
jgi:hypothetical protein